MADFRDYIALTILALVSLVVGLIMGEMLSRKVNYIQGVNDCKNNRPLRYILTVQSNGETLWMYNKKYNP